MDVLLDESNRQAYLSGFTWILLLTLVSAVFSLVLGVILAAMRVSPIPVLRWAGSMWVQLFRNTPLTLIIFFCYFGLFSTLGFKVSNNITVNNFWLGVVGLSVYTAAFVCEAIRAGINSVPAGQAEAARAIGLTFSQSLTMIVLPQAIRTTIAPLGSTLIALCKNTTIVGTIGVIEASTVMKDLINSNGDAVIEIFIMFAGTFAVVLIPTGYLFNWMSRRWAVKT
jgi:glutamate transport system permease protein